MRNVKFILQLLLGFVLILIAVYSPLNEDGRVAVGTAGFNERDTISNEVQQG